MKNHILKNNEFIHTFYSLLLLYGCMTEDDINTDREN